MTTFEEVYNAFYNKMEADENFFNYFDLTEDEVLSLIKDRAHTFLMESIAIILRKCDVDGPISFDDYDDDLETFNFDLTLDEIDMLASLMYEAEYRREFSKLKTRLQHVPTTLQVFSPANERKTIQAFYDLIHSENMTMLDNYMAKDRTTHRRKLIDYASYAEE